MLWPGKKKLHILVNYFIPRHIYVESGSLLSTNAVIVGFSKFGPETLMLVAVPGEVEHAVGTKVLSLQIKLQKTTSVLSGKTDLGSSSKQYCTPWPWCTSQSTISTLKRDISVNIGQMNCIYLFHYWNNHSPLQAVFLPCILRRYGHIIEHTETTGSTAHTVMSWRPGRDLFKTVSRTMFGTAMFDQTHLTRAIPFLTAPVITLSTSCRAAPAASLAQW